MSSAEVSPGFEKSAKKKRQHRCRTSELGAVSDMTLLQRFKPRRPRARSFASQPIMGANRSFSTFGMANSNYRSSRPAAPAAELI